MLTDSRLHGLSAASWLLLTLHSAPMAAAFIWALSDSDSSRLLAVCVPAGGMRRALEEWGWDRMGDRDPMQLNWLTE